MQITETTKHIGGYNVVGLMTVRGYVHEIYRISMGKYIKTSGRTTGGIMKFIEIKWVADPRPSRFWKP